jgi:hypothetical protein
MAHQPVSHETSTRHRPALAIAPPRIGLAHHTIRLRQHLSMDDDPAL